MIISHKQKKTLSMHGAGWDYEMIRSDTDFTDESHPPAF